MRTRILTSLLAIALLTACASPPPDPDCRGTRCQTQEERTQREIERAQDRAISNTIRTVERSVWRMIRGY